MKNDAPKIAALSVLGALAFFSPLALAFSRKTTVLGLPLLPVYLFGVWGALVLVARLLSRRRDP